MTSESTACPTCNGKLGFHDCGWWYECPTCCPEAYGKPKATPKVNVEHKRTFTWLKEPITACLCDCHSEPSIRHILPCCDITYKQYIVDGKVDYKKLDEALEDTYNWRKENDKLKCQCECHVRPGIMHCVPCCNNSR